MWLRIAYQVKASHWVISNSASREEEVYATLILPTLDTAASIAFTVPIQYPDTGLVLTSRCFLNFCRNMDPQTVTGQKLEGIQLEHIYTANHRWV